MNESERCIVFGCPNHRDQGAFVRVLCAPCYGTLTEGRIGAGETFVHELRDRLLASEKLNVRNWQSEFQAFGRRFLEALGGGSVPDGVVDEITRALASASASSCVPRPGGRRCDTHHGLPLYPDGRCLSGVVGT